MGHFNSSKISCLPVIVLIIFFSLRKLYKTKVNLQNFLQSVVIVINQITLKLKVLIKPCNNAKQQVVQATKLKIFSSRACSLSPARVNADDLQNNNSDSSSFLLFLPKNIKEYFTFTYIGNISTSIGLYFTWEMRDRFNVFPGSSKRLRHVTECYWSKLKSLLRNEQNTNFETIKKSSNYSILCTLSWSKS